MATTSITSALVGTAPIAVAGSLKGMAVTMPLATNADYLTPLTLVDAAAAPASPTAKVLYSAYLSDLTSFLFATKPASVPLTPGGPTGPPGGTLATATNIAFASGLFVRSCPANVTFTATT